MSDTLIGSARLDLTIVTKIAEILVVGTERHTTKEARHSLGLGPHHPPEEDR